MRNDGLKKLVENRYGKNIAFSNECEELSVHIKKSIQAIISPQTLRRLLGFIDDDVQPSMRGVDDEPASKRQCKPDSK